MWGVSLTQVVTVDRFSEWLCSYVVVLMIPVQLNPATEVCSPWMISCCVTHVYNLYLWVFLDMCVQIYNAVLEKNQLAMNFNQEYL